MKHIITIKKTEITRGKFEKLQIALSMLDGQAGKDGKGICTDSTTHYEFFYMGNDTRRAEQMKYFAMGFLNMPELESA